MASPAAGEDDLLLLTLESVAVNRRIPHASFRPLLAPLTLPPSPALPRASPRLRRALVLRALDAALCTEEDDASSCSSSLLLLRNARKVLAYPDAAACFPHQISVADGEESDEASAAAAVADLRRLLDLEWANLAPPPKFVLAADGVAAGDRADQTLAAAADNTKRAKRQLLGTSNSNKKGRKSTEREILAKLMQDGSTSHPTIRPKVAGNARKETDGSPRGAEANGKSKADHVQEGMAAAQQGSSVTGAEGVQFPEKTARPRKKRSLFERDPSASAYEWDGSDDDQPARKRSPSKRKLNPSPTCAQSKIKKKWSEIEIKALLEGLEKYGIGKWKNIKLAYPDVFEERSTVDLKDKFRNMLKHHHDHDHDHEAAA